MKIYNTDSPGETYDLGIKLAQKIRSRSIRRAFVALYGDLGAGKTEFVRGFASVLSPGSRVKSPSYTIVNEYLRGETPIYHFDFYRIADINELDGIGFDDYVSGGICIAEWSERLGDAIPDGTITVKLEKLGESGRKITINDTKNDTEIFD